MQEPENKHNEAAKADQWYIFPFPFFKTRKSVKKGIYTRGYNWCSLCHRIACGNHRPYFSRLTKKTKQKQNTDFRTIEPEEQILFPDFRTHSCSTLYDLRSKAKDMDEKATQSLKFWFHGITFDMVTFYHFLSLLNVRTFFLKFCFSWNILDLYFLILFTYNWRLWLEEVGSGS